ncbi:unnamed protein product, partial [Acanthoscelides obtectus]
VVFQKPCLGTANAQLEAVRTVFQYDRFPNPTKFMYVFVQWVDCIGNEAVRDIDPITVYNRYRVCHAHFTVEDNYGNNRLRKDAVPSLNLPDQQISKATDEILGKPSTSASYQQLGEVCSVPTSQPGNLDVTTVEPIEEHYSEASE